MCVFQSANGLRHSRHTHKLNGKSCQEFMSLIVSAASKQGGIHSFVLSFAYITKCVCACAAFTADLCIYIQTPARAQREIYACGYHPFQVGARRNITQLLGGKMLRHLSLSPAARAVSAHKQSSPASSCSCACVRPQLCYRARTDVACGCL
jgi:hypothetical protein